MKRYVWKGISGKWYTAFDVMINDWQVTEHDSWREAYDAAFIMARKVLFNS